MRIVKMNKDTIVITEIKLKKSQLLFRLMKN